MSGTTVDLDPTLAPAEGSGGAAFASATHGGSGVPSRIGRYLVLDEVGAGGMGVVYSAYDPELDRKVAIKLMYAESDRDRARRSHAMLMREAQALAKLSHPNIVAIHDVGEYAGQVFVAMEFVAGCNLRRWRELTPRAWPVVLAAFVQAGRGLLAAHAVGLVHRDVKPDNLLVGDDGRVRVADFGVARHNAPGESEVTSPGGTRALETVAGRGATVGTPAYMAPEQHDNEGVGPHSDQFSFCVALYEALHGLRPFAGETIAALAAAIREGTPRRPPGGLSRLPPWLERAVLRGLAARPEDRWPSMQALLAELTQDRDARRARWRWRVIVGLLLMLGGVALYFGAREMQASRARGRHEVRAMERLAVVRSGIDRLLARGRRADAEEALQAFLAEPEHRGTGAAIDAWLLWAERMETAGDGVAALAAAVEAYTELPVGDRRETAIALRMARLFRAGWRFHELATLAAQAGRRAPETIDDRAWAQLRADTALARRDLAVFLAEVDAGRLDRERELVAPVVRALDAVRFPAVVEAQDIYSFDLEGDGRNEVALFAADGSSEIRRMDAELTLIRRDWPALAIERGPANRFALRQATGHPTLFIGHEFAAAEGETTVYMAGPQPRTLLRWQEYRPVSATTADLDGDGLGELYIGTGPYSRKLYRVAPDALGVWQRSSAHPASEALGSDFNALASGDFDGDGRDELAVAVGPWRAYDVRILEAGADGALQVGARWRLGHVHTLTSLRAADGSTLLAIAKDNDAPSKLAFPASKPNGEPPGLYIVRREGASLKPVYFSGLPLRDGAAPGEVTWMTSGDFDGDGLDDLITSHDSQGRDEYALVLVWRQLADGSFVGTSLGQMHAMLVDQFDDDAADELMVRTRGPDGTMAFAILGAGGASLSAIAATGVPAATPVLADPELARAWTRAEELAGFGLFASAATALERRISLAQTVDDRRAVQLRAAELRDADGDHAAAAAGQELLAQDGDVQAGFAALAGYERALRLVDALRVARWLLARPELDAEQRARAQAASERLVAVVEWGDAVELRFDRPLAPQWQITEPLALRVDPVRGELIVDATAEMGELASLPLTVPGGPFGIEVELEVERAEWASLLQVELVDPSGRSRLRLGVSASGGGGYLTRLTRFDALEEAQIELAHFPTAQPGERSRHQVQVQVLPGQGVLHIEERGDHPDQRTYPLRAPLTAGSYRLVLRSAGVEHYGAHQIRARIKRIAVSGASIGVQAQPMTARERSARALVTGRWRSALNETGGDSLVSLWRAVAAAELGRVAEAVAILAAVDPGEPRLRMHLRHLLRARPALMLPLLRSAFVDELGALLVEALFEPTRMHLDEELQRTWLTLAGDLEALPASDAGQATTKATLLRLRARVWQSLGELVAAADDLDSAVALLGGAASDPETGPTIAELELMRAQVAAARGQTADAIAAATRALAGAREPAWMAERMRMDEHLQELAADPTFTRLLAEHP